MHTLNGRYRRWGRGSTVAHALLLAAGLSCGSTQAMEQSAALNVQLMLTPASCTTSLLGQSLGLSLLNTDCPASAYQISAVRAGSPASAVWGSIQMDALQVGLDSGLLGPTLQQWALVQTDKAWRSSRQSQDIAYYELRVDY